MHLNELIVGIEKIIAGTEVPNGADNSDDLADALDSYYAVKCYDLEEEKPVERLEIGYSFKPLIQIKLGEKPGIEEHELSYLDLDNTCYSGETYAITEEQYKAIEELVKKYESSQRYFPLKSVIACAAGLLAFFAADTTENLTQYSPANQNPATIETQTEYPLSGHSKVGEFIVDDARKRDDDAEELMKLCNSMGETFVE